MNLTGAAIKLEQLNDLVMSARTNNHDLRTSQLQLKSALAV